MAAVRGASLFHLVARADFLCRKADFDTTEVTVHVLMASEPDPTPETYGSRHKPSKGLQQTTLVTYTGARQSKRLRQAKQRKDKRLCISKDMSVKDIKLLVRAPPPSLSEPPQRRQN